MGIPDKGLIFFDGATADIPAGWERWVAGNNRFVIGASDAQEPAVTDGALTHTHTNGSHTHPQSHDHALTISGAVSATNALEAGAIATVIDHDPHRASTVAKDTTPTGAHTIICGPSAGRPKRIEVIALVPTGGETDFPIGCLGLAEKDVSQGDWGITANTDFEDRFMFADSGDGGTATGSDAHNHSLTSHVHSLASHNHANSNFGTVFQGTLLHNTGFIATAMSSYLHHTAVSIQNYGLVSLGTQNAPYDSASSLPPYSTYLAMEYNGGAATDDIPEGLIIGWTGNRADIPAGWEEVTELRELQPRVTRVRSKVGDSGGTTTHTHNAAPHHHVDASAHTHVFTEGVVNTAARTVTRGGTARPSNAHTHGAGGEMGTTTISTDDNTAYSISTENHMYSNITVIFIRKPYVTTVDIDGTTHINGGAIAANA